MFSTRARVQTAVDAVDAGEGCNISITGRSILPAGTPCTRSYARTGLACASSRSSVAQPEGAAPAGCCSPQLRALGCGREGHAASLAQPEESGPEDTCRSGQTRPRLAATEEIDPGDTQT